MIFLFQHKFLVEAYCVVTDTKELAIKTLERERMDSFNFTVDAIEPEPGNPRLYKLSPDILQNGPIS